MVTLKFFGTWCTIQWMMQQFRGLTHTVFRNKLLVDQKSQYTEHFLLKENVRDYLCGWERHHPDAFSRKGSCCTSRKDGCPLAAVSLVDPASCSWGTASQWLSKVALQGSGHSHPPRDPCRGAFALKPPLGCGRLCLICAAPSLSSLDTSLQQNVHTWLHLRAAARGTHLQCFDDFWVRKSSTVWAHHIFVAITDYGVVCIQVHWIWNSQCWIQTGL